MNWLSEKWNVFQDWFASMLPGWKTKLTAFLGLLGNAAYVSQDYITGLNLSQYVTTENLMIANMVLFTMAFWFRGLADREA